jgi:hypothetical protein
MDRDEAIKLLKSGPDGIGKWNRWRNQEEEIIDLRGADLRGADLRGADLSGADLSGADLSVADLRGANFSISDLYDADLSGADLRDADLHDADLRDTDLRCTNLTSANFTSANLRGADLSQAVCGYISFGLVDLSEVKGLESIRHDGPSTVGIDTLALTRGKLPDVFLRGCGLTPSEVVSAKLYRPELTPPELWEVQVQIFDAWTKGRSMLNGCFLSYSWADATFVNKLRDRLMAEGVNVWLDRHDMVAGTIQDQIWRAIQIHHVVIIVLSKDSVNSDWVENELDMARRREKAEKRAVLCPICLDDAWNSKVKANETPGDPSRQLWRTLQQKFVVDFHEWNTRSFDDPFNKLLRGMKTNYGPGASASQ